MSNKRSTIYFDQDVHRAVKMKAAAMDLTLSDVVNEAVRRSLAEDAEDLEAFDKRRREPSLTFEDVVRSMKRRGKL
ncbi:MAG: CopG family transcriptional regulator [Acidobacteria bacterium]|nr:MAG: CopG family transcriptional regulator [Acidobacteriota bacterium]